MSPLRLLSSRLPVSDSPQDRVRFRRSIPIRIDVVLALDFPSNRARRVFDISKAPNASKELFEKPRIRRPIRTECGMSFADRRRAFAAGETVSRGEFVLRGEPKCGREGPRRSQGLHQK